jgi:hypothetical protein
MVAYYLDEADKVQLKDKKKNKKINAKIKKALGREYTQKQIDALSMADAELMLEVAPYLKNRPRARIALDAHLFDIGVMPQEQYKNKLLNIVSNYNEQLKLPDRRDAEGKLISSISKRTIAEYDPAEDKIILGKSARVGKDLKTGKQDYDRRKTIFALLHELEHRGAKIIDAIAGRLGDTERDHKAIAFSDVVTAKDLGIEYDSSYKGNKDAFVEQQKETYDLLKKRPKIAKRFPSIKQYNRGGKVYSNQPRRVRISRGR